MVPYLGSITAILLASVAPKHNTAPHITTTLPVNEKELKYDNLLTWLRTSFQDKSFVSSSVTFSPSPLGGYGAFATAPLKKEELLFTIPLEACVTVSSVLNDADCGKAFGNIIEKAGPGGVTVALAGFLAKEYLLLDNDDAGTYGPYLKTLPWEQSVDQDHILFWTNDEIDQYLTGSMAYQESVDLRSEVKVATRILNSIITPSIRRPPLIPGWKWTALPSSSLDPSVVAKAVTGAFVSLLTRSFEMDDESVEDDSIKGQKLVPILDMMNHNRVPNISHSTDKQTGSVCVRAKVDIEAGQELFNQYREEEEDGNGIMPLHRFFTRFGFVPGTTEKADIQNLLLTKNSSIFFDLKRQEV